MDLVLSLPVWRVTVMVAPAVVATLGGAVLAASVLGGISLGLKTVGLPEEISPWVFLPGTLNLFCMIFCLAGVTTFVSSWNRDRWRTIGLSGGFFVVSLILKIAWRLWPEGGWLKYLTFLSAFRPQMLILDPQQSGNLAINCNLTLLGLGLAAYVAAAIILTYRDIPSVR
jgi:ABC-2 type transport system permease protein